MRDLVFNLMESMMRHLSGSLGRRIRYMHYKRRLGACGQGVIIDEGVYLSNCKSIFIADNVWIDKNCILIAGKTDKEKHTKQIGNKYFEKQPGEIHLGQYSHLGIGTVIQGHGGVQIDECFTSSAGCKLYSLSNDPIKCNNGTNGHQDIYYIASPIRIFRNVWLGLNVSMVGNTVHSDCFIHAGSMVSKDIETNSIAAGSPAIRIKQRFT